LRNQIQPKDYRLEKLDFCKTDGIEIYELLWTLGYEISDKNTNTKEKR
jgi:hypothetical protein